MFSKLFFSAVLLTALISSCNAGNSSNPATIASTDTNASIVCGAERVKEYLPFLRGKKIALLVNQTSVVGTTHIVDTLLTIGLNIQKIFAPEHGFRGEADAGEHVTNESDRKTGLPVVSLYGNKKNPSTDDLADIDVVVFDIQDVGARFYTFISSLHYLMQACAENNKELIVLDRPNPNGWYVDGPVLEKEFQSFVGVDAIPVVHGLTVGEYAQMINGEKWLQGGAQCRLKVVTCLNYTHATRYSLPIKPSPNLPNDVAVYLYPSLCFFEGTDVSVGRGTDFPFQVIGSPRAGVKEFSFTPESKSGAKNPPHLNEVCYGIDLKYVDKRKGGVNLSYLVRMLQSYKGKESFFLPNNFFDKLAGNATLKKQLLEGKSESEIKQSWAVSLTSYKQMRKKYLLYQDFE